MELMLRRRLGTDYGGRRCGTGAKTGNSGAGWDALLLCDVWDAHWCRELLSVWMDCFHVWSRPSKGRSEMRRRTPSDTMEFYVGSPARQRALDVPQIELNRLSIWTLRYRLMRPTKGRIRQDTPQRLGVASIQL